MRQLVLAIIESRTAPGVGMPERARQGFIHPRRRGYWPMVLGTAPRLGVGREGREGRGRGRVWQLFGGRPSKLTVNASCALAPLTAL